MKKKLLVVEDNPADRDLLNIGIEETQVPIIVEFVASAEEAIDALASKEYDCLLTDWNLPGVQGRDLLAHVGDRWPSMPVVVMSGTHPDWLSPDDKPQLADVTFVHKSDQIQVIPLAIHETLCNS